MENDQTGLRTQDRIKTLRQKLGITQQELADRLGIKRNTIATWESGRNAPIDAILTSICREYGVSMTWLTKGEGPMFADQKGDLGAVFEAYKVGPREKVLIERFLSLSDTQRDAVLKFISDVAAQLSTVAEAEPLDSEQSEIDRKVELYREELELEARTQNSRASPGSDSKLA